MTALLYHQPSHMADMPTFRKRHTPRNSATVEIEETLPKAEKMRTPPKKTAKKKQENAKKE